MKIKIRKIVLVSLHALFLLTGTWFLLNTERIRGDEAQLIKWSSNFKRTFNKTRSPNPKEVIFIDVSKSLSLIPAEDSIGKQVITNRQDLTGLLRSINQTDNYNFVLCDLRFEDKTPYDEGLLKEIQQMKDDFVGLGGVGINNRYTPSILDIPTGVAYYKESNGIALKFPLLLHDSLKSIPVIMYEQLDSGNIVHSNGLVWDKGRLTLSAPIVDFSILPSQVNFEKNSRYEAYTLAELKVFLNDKSYTKELFKDRIIVVGNFATDIHPTVLGDMSGVLIVFNAYWSLRQGDHLIRWSWVLLLFLGYVWISWVMIYGIKFNSWNKHRIIKYYEKYIDLAAYLSLLTLLSYLLFNIHISIFLILTYALAFKFIRKQLIKNKTHD